MKLRKLETALLATSLALLLVGCETTSTSYEYSPPKNASGAKCIRKCLELKQYSSQSCEFNERTCLDRLVNNGKSDTENFHPRHLCNFDKAECVERAESDYRQCYAACGGSVKTITKN